MRPVSNTTGTVLLTVGVPLNRRYTTTVPDWKAVPSGYVMDALNLACCPTAKFVFAVTITDRVAGESCGGFVILLFWGFFSFAWHYSGGARVATSVPLWWVAAVLLLRTNVLWVVVWFTLL